MAITTCSMRPSRPSRSRPGRSSAGARCRRCWPGPARLARGRCAPGAGRSRARRRGRPGRARRWRGRPGAPRCSGRRLARTSAAVTSSPGFTRPGGEQHVLLHVQARVGLLPRVQPTGRHRHQQRADDADRGGEEDRVARGVKSRHGASVARRSMFALHEDVVDQRRHHVHEEDHEHHRLGVGRVDHADQHDQAPIRNP